MTRIKPTVSLFRVWQRELDGVLAHFSTTYTFYYCGYALALPWSSCSSHHVTHCDCDHCDKVTWYFPTLHLANLPSHDNYSLFHHSLRYLVILTYLVCLFQSVELNDYCTMYYCRLIYKLCLHKCTCFFISTAMSQELLCFL